MEELVQILQSYLISAKTLEECAEWLAGVDWDDPDFTPEAKEPVGMFELLAVDIFEGLRDEGEFREASANFIASATGQPVPTG